MKPVVPKPQRCAIYTRKSTEHNLDLEFNSLDAQLRGLRGLHQEPGA
jgi:site-specific DNA recombinase